MFSFNLDNPESAFIKLRIDSGKYNGLEINALQISPCPDPICECGNIYFKKQSNFETNESYFLDVSNRKVGLFKGEKFIENDLTAALTKEINAAKWEELFYFYSYFKANIIEEIVVDELKLDLEEEEIERINKGELFGFKYFFPWSLNFVFETNEITYALIDQYNLKPNDLSTQVIFNVVDFSLNKIIFDVAFDYVQKAWNIIKIHENYSQEKINMILTQAQQKLGQDILEITPLHHENLRKLTKAQIQRQMIEKSRGSF